MVGVALEHLAWQRPDADAASTYSVVQRLTYLAVVCGLFPAFLWTGLGMSFGMTSVFPILATALGGHQSARTLHFVCVVVLLLFVMVHILRASAISTSPFGNVSNGPMPLSETSRLVPEPGITVS